MIVKGQRAELRVGYQLAAVVSPYHLEEEKPSALDAKPETPKPKQWLLSGEVKERNDFWLTRGPFEVRVFVGEKREWKWKGVRPVIGGTRIGATLEGDPER